MVFSIFMDSKVQRLSPCFTVCPTFTSMESTVPGTGAVMESVPREPPSKEEEALGF